ncbi:CRISPR-associated protein Cas4 [Halorubrum ezzemoulense]|uniref:CRISPR-associated protein Cas4 n=1 Tax=Halorubrum ezzemoulense TaxID=337243 RepID=UPI003F6DD79E
MGKPELRSRPGETENKGTSPRTLVKRLRESTFENWYRDRKYAENIRQGKPYFNGPPKVQPTSRHSPSRLLQCHRRSWYNHLNSAEEDGPPQGIFWFGTRFEEDLIMPFLSDTVINKETYACNSLWVDYTVDTDHGEVRIKGETDPVIVDEDSVPLLLLEVKTKQSVDGLSEPNQHHRAQLHAYLHGLSEKYDTDLERAAIIYGSRSTLETEVFEVEFDQAFWEDTVLQWAADQTKYRTYGALPPAEPEHDWECKFCSYRERCGRGDREYSDSGPVGLLPIFSDYPRQSVVEYLDSHPDSKLTPTLAHNHPSLVENYGAYDWSCSACEATYSWNAIDPPSSSHAPRCPECRENGEKGWLSGPTPDEQLRIEGADDVQ